MHMVVYHGYLIDLCPLIMSVFSLRNFLDLGTVALLLLFGN